MHAQAETSPQGKAVRPRAGLLELCDNGVQKIFLWEVSWRHARANAREDAYGQSMVE